MQSKIQLSDHFDNRRLIGFTLPSVIMLLFTSIYGMVDGYFVSNYVGKTAFASVNIIIPALQVIGGIGAMLGVGGSALTAVTIGEGDEERAGQYFTMMIKLMVITSVVTTLLGIVLLRPISILFGATEAMMEDCMVYGTICMLFNLALHAQYTMQSYIVVAEQPKLGLYITVLAGLTNMLLDYLFMAVLKMGVAGAALATGFSECVGGIIPFWWFISKKNTSHLRFKKAKINLAVTLKACGNGASEMLSSVSASITGILYNRQLITYAGEDGVAAYGTVMYVGFVFLAVFAGYSSGMSPIMGYHYGAQNHSEMTNVLKRSLYILGISAVVLTVVALTFAKSFASFFVGYDANLLEMTARAFRICSLPFFIMWFNIYSSSFFTALNDGKVSAVISFMRSLVFPLLCIIVMPIIWGLDGVWYSLVANEVLNLLVSLYFMINKRKKYGYWS